MFDWGGPGVAVDLDLVGLAVDPALLFATNLVLPSMVIDYIGWVSFQPVAQIVLSLVESGNYGNNIHLRQELVLAVTQNRPAIF